MNTFPSPKIAVNAREQLSAPDEMLRRQSDELAEQEARNRELESKIAVQEVAFARLLKQLAEVRKALAEREHTISALVQSRSWKVTRPLRYIGRLLRGATSNVEPRFRLVKEWWIIRRSGFFDSELYLKNNPDVASSGFGLLWHYLRFGATEGRDPHPLFCTSFYLNNNSDVANSGVNPLFHYLRRGAAEGRSPHPLFDSSYYLKQYPDVAKAGINPLVHYLRHGAYEGRDPSPQFSSSYYLERNPDVAKEGLNPLVHYLAHSGRLSVLPSATLLAQTNVGGFDLRAALRNEFAESGRVLLDSEYDSYPLVSVLIPCFNQGHFLEDAVLSSLLACSYPMEIIVVDDGSTDARSVALIDELAKIYKFTLIRQANTGLAGARNTGIRRARGKFVQFLDADDLLAAGKVDVQVDEFRSDPDIDVCVSEYELCDAKGFVRQAVNPSTIAGFSFSREEFLLRWERGLSIPIHCALFRRELLENAPFRLVTEAGKEDWIFWVELSSRSPKFKFNPMVLATYRIHDRNTVSRHEEMGLDFLRACLYITHTGLNKETESFLRESVHHFRTAYLGSIKHDAILGSRSQTGV